VETDARTETGESRVALSMSEWHYEQQAPPAAALDRGFDYIVVGAGAAGCALARGLSADLGVTVLLLDLGGAGHADQRVRDGGRWKETLGSPIDQAIRTVGQPGLHDSKTGAPGRVIVANQGRTLGGSTALNATFWVRGNPSDYDYWAAACGCDGWSHADLLPTLRRIETWCGGAAGANSARRGTAGPVSVAHDLCRGDVAYDELLETAASRCGFQMTGDYNGAGGRGDEGCDCRDTMGYMQFNVDAASGERHDAFSSFVQPVLEQRPNLAVATSLRAVRVVFSATCSGQAPTCVGVEVERVGGAAGAPARSVLAARREVVLCAGALRTPQLLMLSGIGDGAVLARHGIQPVAEAAEVGQGLQDHPFVQATHIERLGPPGGGGSHGP
jgi:choline dehydrogenase